MNHIYIIQTNLKDDSIFLEKVKSLGAWQKYFPNSIIIKSALTSHQVYQNISVGYENNWILITEITKSNFYGMMPKEIWDWLRNVD